MEKNFLSKIYDNITHNPPMVLTLGFAIVITIGALLLRMPFFSRSGNETSLIDALFVAASASCVTGLTPVNTLEHWNSYGHLLLIVLIQIGGLGVMSITSMIPLILGKKIGLSSRQILKEQLNVESLEGMIALFKYVLFFSFGVELIGAMILAIRFVPIFGLAKGLWVSIFHSISAFCNAGFDIMGDSIYPLRKDVLVNTTLMLLIIIGGLGFMVTSEFFYRRKFKQVSTHSKLVLIINAVLILFGALGFLILESIQKGVLVGEGIKGSLIESFFQSVSARTAGFYSVNLSNIKDSTSLLLIGLMFIGGSPGSTAGGIKTTTFGVLVLATYSIIKRQKEPVVFNKHIGDETIKKALSIFMISLAIVLMVTFAITITDDFTLVDTLYEVVSALATVGASRGITASLSKIAKILIGLCMYLGRIGPMTMALAFGLKPDEKLIRYPECFISIG